MQRFRRYESWRRAVARNYCFQSQILLAAAEKNLHLKMEKMEMSWWGSMQALPG